MGILDRILRAGEGKKIKALEGMVPDINAFEPEISALSDDALKAKTAEFRQRLDNGADLDDLLLEAFAVCREAAKRTIGQRHYDVQMMGGAALHFGWVAEMKTGEGKTLVSTLPAYLNGLTGKGVHLVTVNDYLARRDAEWMGRIHRWLGLNVGLIIPGYRNSPAEKRASYDADITYATNNEMGFDYLRDNMAQSKADKVQQRGHNYCIVDEVDSILIDEARTPLIISGRVGDAAKLYYRFASIVRGLQRDVDYEVEEDKRVVVPLEEGIEKVERALEVENLYDNVQANLVHQFTVALKAKELYKRDKDYIVQGGEVKIVDEFTGRILEGRRWSEGIHQAVEAKEGVKIKEENQTLATITLQNYFRMYDKLAGMTGTAQTEAAELMNTYGLGVVPIPTNRPLARIDARRPDLQVRAGEVRRDHRRHRGPPRQGPADPGRHRQRRPVRDARPPDRRSGASRTRCSTPSSTPVKPRSSRRPAASARSPWPPTWRVAASTSCSAATPRASPATTCSRRATPPTCSSTSSNCRCRSTRCPRSSAKPAPRRSRATRSCSPSTPPSARPRARPCANSAACTSSAPSATTAVASTTSCAAAPGRQGDPGESRFFLSLDDDLMRLFATGALNYVMGRALPDDEAIEAKMVTKAIERAQTTVETKNAEIRKNVLKYDEVMNEQRKVIYKRRDQILDGEDLRSAAMEYLAEAVDALIGTHCASVADDEWDLDGLAKELTLYWPNTITDDDLRQCGDTDEIYDVVMAEATEHYERREHELGEDVLRQVERQVMLRIIDQRWREHLEEMDYLQGGINLRAMGQKDPLTEWQREGFEMFGAMMTGIAQDFVKYVMHVQVVQNQVPAVAGDAPAVQNMQTSSLRRRRHRRVRSGGARCGSPRARCLPTQCPPRPHRTKQQTVVKDAFDKTPRNAPCPCGSGKKFKQCHGAA